jgi:hypothetical protein
VDFNLPLTNGLFSLGAANAGAKFDRKSERKFEITNSFEELHLLPHQDCANAAAKIGNIVYPITGKIGLEEVFETFIKMDHGVGITTKGATSNFSDTLTFTTTLSAGVTPKITLNPIPRHVFQVADTSIALTEMRTDQHQVAINLAKGSPLKSIEQARSDAKTISKAIATQRRTEDLFIIPRGNVVIAPGVQ